MLWVFLFFFLYFKNYINNNAPYIVGCFFTYSLKNTTMNIPNFVNEEYNLWNFVYICCCCFLLLLFFWGEWGEKWGERERENWRGRWSRPAIDLLICKLVFFFLRLISSFKLNRKTQFQRWIQTERPQCANDHTLDTCKLAWGRRKSVLDRQQPEFARWAVHANV